MMNFFMLSPQGLVIDILTQRARASLVSRYPAAQPVSCYSFQRLVTEKGRLKRPVPELMAAAAISKDYHAIQL
jgi:hypothetical protein